MSRFEKFKHIHRIVREEIEQNKLANIYPETIKQYETIIDEISPMILAQYKMENIFENPYPKITQTPMADEFQMIRKAYEVEDPIQLTEFENKYNDYLERTRSENRPFVIGANNDVKLKLEGVDFEYENADKKLKEFGTLTVLFDEVREKSEDYFQALNRTLGEIHNHMLRSQNKNENEESSTQFLGINENYETDKTFWKINRFATALAYTIISVIFIFLCVIVTIVAVGI